MKKIIFISFVLLAYNSEIYSKSTIDCMSNLSIFAEYAKVKNYDSAYEPWVAVKNECPDLNSAIYIYRKNLNDFIKKTKAMIK